LKKFGYPNESIECEFVKAESISKQVATQIYDVVVSLRL
jgi:hypothetical protein